MIKCYMEFGLRKGGRMSFDYMVHSDFLIHWTGKDIDKENDKNWHLKLKTEISDKTAEEYLERLRNILKHGLWMTEEGVDHELAKEIPNTSRTCFTELKLSESRKHAKAYGRLGIGVKRCFVSHRGGRPLVYYNTDRKNEKDIKEKDIFLQEILGFYKAKMTEGSEGLALLNFFKPMHAKKDKFNNTNLNYAYFDESEWRILYSKDCEDKKEIVDPKCKENDEEFTYRNTLESEDQGKLKYLLPLKGWLAMIIYPANEVKKRVHESKEIQELITGFVKETTGLVKETPEPGIWPIELDLDACRNF